MREEGKDSQPPSPPERERRRKGQSAVRIPRTRAGTAWWGSTIALALIVGVLIFIIQNNRSVEISWLVWHVRLSLAIALLLGTIGGASIAFLLGSYRMIELRRAVRRSRTG
jgi:uncharacterized integral membrane protein